MTASLRHIEEDKNFIKDSLPEPIVEVLPGYTSLPTTHLGIHPPTPSRVYPPCSLLHDHRVYTEHAVTGLEALAQGVTELFVTVVVSYRHVSAVVAVHDR